MRFSLTCIAFVALLGEAAFAAPIYARQGAGVGAGCDSIVSDADTMIGESSRGQGKNIAGIISGDSNARRYWARQGAGVGAGCDSIVSDADTMIGESSRGQGKNVAGIISGDGNARRQLNGIADGATAITGTVPGAGPASDSMDTFLNDVDGDGTNGSAEFGQDIGNEEVNLGNSIGGPNGQNGNTRRQLNGIADGATAITGTIPGAGPLSDNMDSFLNTVDGQGTDDSAEAGAIVGDEELDIGSTVGGKNGQNGGGTAPPPRH